MKAPPVYESFKYIHRPEHEHVQSEILDYKYSSVDALDNRFVVYSSGVGYRVYRTRDDYFEHFELMEPRERVFHEVIFDTAQKLKFDVDAPLSKLDVFEIPTEDIETLKIAYDPHAKPVIDYFGKEFDALFAAIHVPMHIDEPIDEDPRAIKYRHIFDVISRTVRDTFFMTYGKDVLDTQWVVCESRDKEKVATKYSNHMIINQYKVSGFEQAREFTRRVNTYLPERYRSFLDIGVNKRIQNFRLVGCHKNEDNRVKNVVSEHSHADTIITNTDECDMLPDIAVKEVTKMRSDMHPEDVTKVLEICSNNKITTHHKYKFNRNGMFVFSRIIGSMCEFCNRNHDSDNTIIVTTSINDGVISVFKQCRRYNDEHGTTAVAIGSFPSSSSGIEIHNENDMRLQERLIGSWTDRTIDRSLKATQMHAQTMLFDTLEPNLKNVYDEPALRPFELSHTLIVHAMMKMGKTKALRDYIGRYFPDGLRQNVIRFVSFRQTFSGNIKEKFPNFTLYSDVKGMLSQAKLIIQVESLHRLDIQRGDETPDLLILDECESIFEQFHAGLTNNYECFSKFQYLIAHSKHVVCMDANISDRTFRILRQMRPGFAERCVYHCNRYKNATDDNYFVTGDKLKWLGVLYSSIEADERIAVPMSSLTEAKILVRNLTKKYPDKHIKLYSSETTMSEKREHFADVNTHWSQYDILVYTPTVSAGVSFELKHFNKVFGYFTDQSCPVETCGQMIGRIRDVADHKFYMCIQATGNNMPTDIDAIKEWVTTKRENLFRNYDDSGLVVEYGPDGERKCYPMCGDYFHMWLENTRVKNLSKNSFIQRFIDIVGFTGANVYQLTDQIFTECTGLDATVDGELNSDLEDIRIAHSVAKTEVREEVCRKIAVSRELAEGELEDIHNAIVAQQDISEEQKFAFEKHRLRADYKFAGDIDEKFVDKYRDAKIRRMFKNISRIYGYGTNDEALKQIQSEERANYLFMMELGEKSQHHELNRKYVFDQHRFTLGLLGLCGWKNIIDPVFIHKVSLVLNLRNNEKLYWEHIKPACIEFGIKSPNLQLVAANKNNDDKLIELMVKPVNKILAIMYGVQIISRRNDPNMFFLAQNNMFTTDPEKSRKKGLPLILQPKKTVMID